MSEVGSVTRIEHDIAIPMRDGVLLRANVWRAEDAQPRPVVLFRTPYDKSALGVETLTPQQCVNRGYIAVVQDTRGRYASQGQWDPLAWSQEGVDGYDTVEWIAQQPWCDGNVVMAGTSFQAIVQWLAAMQKPPHLRAIAPAMSTSAAKDAEQTGGVLRLDHTASWLAFTALDWLQRHAATGEPVDPALAAHVWELLVDPSRALDRWPLTSVLDHPDLPTTLRDVVDGRVDTMAEYQYDAIDIPTLSVGGWFDVFLHGTVELHRIMRSRHPDDGRHQLVVGPWVHSGALPQVQGELNMGLQGSAAGARLADMHLDFFDRQLGRTAADTTADPPPAVRYFLVGADQWHGCDVWPPAEAVAQTWHLAGGSAPAAAGGGRLSPDGPAPADGRDHFTYDPYHPVPSHGGRVLQLGRLVAGPRDQRSIEDRPDVLCYTSDWLTRPLDVVGRQRVVVHFTSNRPATDLVVKLTDVQPDGRSLVVAEGSIRLTALTPGAAGEVEILLGDTAWRFQPGHRIRLLITSSNFPHCDRNPNTGEPPAHASAAVSAEQAIFHGPAHPSALLLQVLPDPQAASPPQHEPAPQVTAPSDVLDPADAKVPTAEQCVLEPLLRRRAAEQPDAPYAVLPDGTSWSYADAWQEAAAAAAGLQALGLTRGDHIMSWLPNGGDALRTWFGANLIGAVLAPINVSYRAAMLQHVLSDCQPRLLVCRPALAQRLAEVDTGTLQSVVLLPGPDDEELVAQVRAQLTAAGLTVVVGLDGQAADFASPTPPVQPWDPQTIIYTSGTTGPSKGVVSSYAHLYSSCTAAFHGRTQRDDRYLLQLPLFHAGGTIGAYGMLVYGASVAVIPGFSTNEFWDVVRDRGVTMCTLLGVMVTYLLKQEPHAGDRDNPLREAIVIPQVAGTAAFADRFGVEVRTLFNMTEVSCPLVGEPGAVADMYCGRARTGIDARVVDEHDRELPPGQVGELVLRCHRPWGFANGYLGSPAQTARAWRNGWFHTGDAFRRLPDGGFVFVDRIKDVIRRRGENISSFELEGQVLAHPGVQEAAAVAVPGEDGEDEVLLVVAPKAAPLAAADLLQFLRERLPHFMVPRFVRFVSALPKTPTGKARKHELRAEGVTADTWDRERAGISIKREHLR